jgi:ABC-type taurine transport system substrate-binding protein
MPVVATHPPDVRRFERILRAVRAEYDEMPGMMLTCPQLRRLFRLTPEECQAVVACLTAEQYLTEDAEHQFFRR